MPTRLLQNVNALSFSTFSIIFLHVCRLPAKRSVWILFCLSFSRHTDPVFFFSRRSIDLFQGPVSRFLAHFRCLRMPASATPESSEPLTAVPHVSHHEYGEASKEIYEERQGKLEQSKAYLCLSFFEVSYLSFIFNFVFHKFIQ